MSDPLIRSNAKLSDVYALVCENNHFSFVTRARTVLELNGLCGWSQPGQRLSTIAIGLVAELVAETFSCPIDVTIRNSGFTFIFQRPPHEPLVAPRSFRVTLQSIQEALERARDPEAALADIHDHFNQAGTCAVGMIFQLMTGFEYSATLSVRDISWTATGRRPVRSSLLPPKR